MKSLAQLVSGGAGIQTQVFVPPKSVPSKSRPSVMYVVLYVKEFRRAGVPFFQHQSCPQGSCDAFLELTCYKERDLVTQCSLVYLMEMFLTLLRKRHFLCFSFCLLNIGPPLPICVGQFRSSFLAKIIWETPTYPFVQ